MFGDALRAERLDDSCERAGYDELDAIIPRQHTEPPLQGYDAMPLCEHGYRVCRRCDGLDQWTGVRT